MGTYILVLIFWSGTGGVEYTKATITAIPNLHHSECELAGNAWKVVDQGYRDFQCLPTR